MEVGGRPGLDGVGIQAATEMTNQQSPWERATDERREEGRNNGGRKEIPITKK